MTEEVDQRTVVFAMVVNCFAIAVISIALFNVEIIFHLSGRCLPSPVLQIPEW
jgi:hypothetical protein